MYKKLFIPGPTHVRPSILEAQTAPMIGHRSTEYSDLQAEVTPKLQKMLYTEQIVTADCPEACPHPGMWGLFRSLVQDRSGQWHTGRSHRHRLGPGLHTGHDR